MRVHGHEVFSATMSAAPSAGPPACRARERNHQEDSTEVASSRSDGLTKPL